jgi:RNA polymerase sigma factor for flagellar operon FliA
MPRTPAPDPVVGEIADLWDRFRAEAAEDVRERLILNYAPLVKFVAGRVGASLPPSVDHNDLVSYGIVGLIESIERFDPDRDVKFETYAIPRIRGAMLDELRALDWVPRSVRAKGRELDRAMTKLQNDLRRDPTEEELAGELGCNVDEVRARLDSTVSMSIVALEDLLTVSSEDGDRVSLLDTLPDVGVEMPGAAIEANDVRVALRQAIEGLGERDRKVVVLYYLEGFTLARIGDILGVTESRVSQIHSKAVMALRSRMAELLSH